MPWNLRWHIAISLAFLCAIAVLWRAEAAPQKAGLVWSGYGTIESWATQGNRGPDDTGRLCWGEDGQNRTQLSGTMEAGEVAPAALPHVCQYRDADGDWIPGSGGGIGFYVSASSRNGQADLEARIVRPDGTVITHGDGLVCVSDTVWTIDPNINGGQAVGSGGLEGGDWRLEVINRGRTARNVTVVYEMFMSYVFNGRCPPGDIIVNGQ